jgi:hypothetical protein
MLEKNKGQNAYLITAILPGNGCVVFVQHRVICYLAASHIATPGFLLTMK